VTVLAPGYGTDPELYYLDDARRVAAGDRIDLGDHTVTFRDAPFVDSAMTVWMTEEETGTFFTVDWLTFTHLDDECCQYGDDLERDLITERQAYLAGHKYSWFPYADADLLKSEINYMIDEYDPAILAPAHAPVMRNATEVLESWKGVIDRCVTEGLIGNVVA
jgi:flavorubredoxin